LEALTIKNYKLHFIRHGATEYNASGRYLGCRNDIELSPEGIRELISLKEEYYYPPVQALFCSASTRCIQTAGILYPDTEISAARSLGEMDLGEFEGKTVAELGGRNDFAEWIANSLENSPPGGETGREFLARITSGVSQIINYMLRNNIEEAAVIAPGGVISALLASVGIPRRPVNNWPVGPGRGYTAYINSQLWMRDRLIEVVGIMPHGSSSATGAK